ncbi:predicted GPI-anchored protein 58 [Vicia villosa]|uniref:predicted GPI-anchored protein 58 n=1 Tax=Vicia villosa TaxID=3911 RepID=UPI00273A910E|nr:predicted GPI-anchored protein 58 [Vicia villosa]
MTDRASQLRHNRVTQHASVQRERSQATQPPLASRQAVPNAPATTLSSNVPPTTPASHSRRDSPVHPSPSPSSRGRTSPPSAFEAGEASGSQATLEVPEAQSQPQSEPQSQPPSHTQTTPKAARAPPAPRAPIQPAAPQAFGVGPFDLSFLPLYPDHVARRIWEGHDRDTLKVISHGRKISRLVPSIEPWFDELLEPTGLKDLALCGYNVAN